MFGFDVNNTNQVNIEMEYSESCLTFDNLRSPVREEINRQPVMTPVSCPPQSPQVDLVTDSQHEWMNSISPEDLIFSGKKEGQSQSCTFSPAFGADIFALHTQADLSYIKLSNVISDPALLMFEQGTSTSIKTEPIESPTTPKRGRKRKDNLASSQLPVIEGETGDVKPICSQLKRTATNADFTMVGDSKKIKKYMLNPEVVPGAKNARAAHINREKKKKETESLKSEVVAKSRRIEMLEAQLEAERLEKEQIKAERDAERVKNQRDNGLRGVTQNIKDYLTAVIPSLTTTHGPFNIEFSGFFGDVGVEDQYAVQVLGDPMLGGERPSEFFTTHVNMNERRMVIDYNPRFAGDTGGGGTQ